MTNTPLVRLGVTAVALVFCLPVAAQAQQPASTTWDVTAARGKTRDIDFTTNEGTWTSVDVSSDGTWLVFDLLGHIYRVAARGGEATALTQSSGVATNYHPRISPDGHSIAFVSDRRGQNNLWIMDADGGNPRPVFVDQTVRAVEPAWTPDGQFIIVRRQQLGSGEGGGGASGLWMYHKDGGTGVPLVTGTTTGAPRQPEWPSVSRDGKYVYFFGDAPQPTVSGRNDVVQGSKQLYRFDRRTGAIAEVTAGVSVQQHQGSSGGAVAPEVSPDGRFIAFARRIPDATLVWKGHEFGPRTALWIRDLESGTERVLMDPIEFDLSEGIKALRVLPGYAWAPDGKSIIVPQGGKIRRVDVAAGTVSTIAYGSGAPNDLGDGLLAGAARRRPLRAEVPAVAHRVGRRQTSRLSSSRARLGDGRAGVWRAVGKCRRASSASALVPAASRHVERARRLGVLARVEPRRAVARVHELRRRESRSRLEGGRDGRCARPSDAGGR